MADRVTVRVTAELVEALDRFIAAQLIPARSRQDAFRHIAEDWLTSKGYLAPDICEPRAVERADCGGLQRNQDD